MVRIKGSIEEWGSVAQTSLSAKLYGFKKQRTEALATLSGLDLLIYRVRYAQDMYYRTRILEHKHVMLKLQKELDRYLLEKLQTHQKHDQKLFR
jgi:hypothetical protein